MMSRRPLGQPPMPLNGPRYNEFIQSPKVRVIDENGENIGVMYTREAMEQAMAAGLDLVLGNWRRPRIFHAVLRFGERCERRIDLWGVGKDTEAADAEVEAVMRSIETLMRSPGTGPQKVRELRRWAATKLAPGGDDASPPARPGDNGAN